jgi:hypothetical protein
MSGGGKLNLVDLAGSERAADSTSKDAKTRAEGGVQAARVAPRRPIWPLRKPARSVMAVLSCSHRAESLTSAAARLPSAAGDS